MVQSHLLRNALLFERQVEQLGIPQPSYPPVYSVENSIGSKGCKYLSRAGLKSLEGLNLSTCSLIEPATALAAKAWRTWPSSAGAACKCST